MNVEVIGITAGILSCTMFLPQVIKTWKSKSTNDVSLAMFLIAATGAFLWLVYGILIDSFSITFTNVFVFILSVIMLYLKIRYKEDSSDINKS